MSLRNAYPCAAPTQRQRLHHLHIARRHIPRYASLLNFYPPISRVLLDQNEPLPFGHGMLVAALRRVFVQRFHIPELLGTPLGRDCRSLLLNRGRCRRRSGRVGVCRLGPCGQCRRRRRRKVYICRGHQALFRSQPHLDPARAIYTVVSFAVISSIHAWLVRTICLDESHFAALRR